MPTRRQGRARKPQGGEGKQTVQASETEDTQPSVHEEGVDLISLTGSTSGTEPTTEDRADNNKLLMSATNALCLEDNTISPQQASPNTGEPVANTTTLLNPKPQQGMDDEKENGDNNEDTDKIV